MPNRKPFTFNSICLTAITLLGICAVSTPAIADDLFKNGNWANLASDRKASEVGDILHVVVYQSAEATNTTRSATEKSYEFGGELNARGFNEFGNARLGRGFNGRGEVRRSESLLTHISVVVVEVYGNGNMVVSGRQSMKVNGESTLIGVRGVVRPEDISHENQVLSNKIAQAQINYNGEGFVSKGAKPGLIDRIFGFLGLV